MRIHIHTLVSVLCALFFPGAAAFAQRPPPSAPTELDFPLVDVYGQKRAFAESLDFGEKVNLDTGELTFQVTDVSIPGNSALAVQFGRRLRENGFLPTLVPATRLGLGGWITDIPMITGVVSKDYYDGTQGPSVWPGVPWLGGPRGYWKGLYLVIPGQVAKKLHWTKPGTAGVSDFLCAEPYTARQGEEIVWRRKTARSSPKSF